MEMAGSAAVPVRSVRERIIQTVLFEAVGLALVAPAFALVMGTTGGESLTLLAMLSLVIMGWGAIYNTLFDLAESWLAGRVASDRPQGWRLVHAALLELTAIVVTAPIVMHMLDVGVYEAILTDLGLTAVYMAYGYVYHLCFDRLRPVRAAEAR